MYAYKIDFRFGDALPAEFAEITLRFTHIHIHSMDDLSSGCIRRYGYPLFVQHRQKLFFNNRQKFQKNIFHGLRAD